MKVEVETNADETFKDRKIAKEFLQEFKKVWTGSVIVYINQGQATEILTQHKKKLE